MMRALNLKLLQKLCSQHVGTAGVAERPVRQRERNGKQAGIRKTF
jgi:hypothetical protein